MLIVAIITTVNAQNRNTRNIPNSHIFLIDSLLADGISYKKLVVTINGLKHCINVLQVDLQNPKTDIRVVKGGNNITELERLQDMFANTTVDFPNEKIMGGINTNFWRAYTNYPIGPTVINGEVVEMPSYKKWTSTFFNEDGLPFMNFFNLQCEVLTKTGNRVNVNSVNRRSNQNGIVVYNKYGGDVIPYINAKKVQELLLANLDNAFQNSAMQDSTEGIESLAIQKEELLLAERSANLEYNLRKIVVRYSDKPAVNTFIRGEVIDIIVGAVQMPEHGYVISLGEDFDNSLLPQIGDNIFLHFWTNVHESEVFTSAISGTPRLVRDGVARHEATEEGSTSRRFINGALPRTAIGYDRDKTKLFLVTVGRHEGTVGTSLAQLADVMEYIGCYSAQNLDGGGSTNMVIGTQNIINPGASRRLSVGLAVLSLKKDRTVKLPRRERSD